jgi:hypothetical protein
MYSRLNHHLIINNILAMEQYGFRKDRSTEHAAYTLINGILQAWNSKLQVAGIIVGGTLLHALFLGLRLGLVCGLDGR